MRAVKEQAPTSSIVLLTRLARTVYRSSPESLLGLKLKELAVLAYLRDHGQVSQQQLSTGLCTDANTCVLVLNQLESADWVQRRRDPADRRRHLVELTADGLAALHSAEAAQATIEDEVLSALSPEERETLQELLRRALEGAPRALPQPDFAVSH
ncbi:MAG TPA: MarR family winged helix-turn-helix transcriptional regulator [Solirubrobacteraceae bacterium]|jgi:DNA-binding MarR family transcriptional regulator|nr:MarR family winged helix-turn-helix transcriptional regulator [Solirubrobacteraceae bacterium]